MAWSALVVISSVVTGCDGEESSSSSRATGGGGAGQGGAALGGMGSGAAGGTASGGTASGGGSNASVPEPPAELTRYLTGNDEDADVTPMGPGLILMGGGADVDAAFSWWGDKIAGGDVVVLRASGSDGYNAYLYEDFAAVDSVETMLVTSASLANDDYVAWRVRHAEGVFMAGGDQAEYMTFWKGTALEDAMHEAWSRGAVVGGTSAGCAVLGAFVFAAYNDTVYSDEALEDPYNTYMELDRDFLSWAPLARVITDTHFADRDRFGRLLGFVARIVQDGWSPNPMGIGVDERTALVVDASGMGEVLGSGSVYLMHANGMPQQCQPGLPLEYASLSYHRLQAGDTVSLPDGTTSVTEVKVSASGGVTAPADPY